MAGCLMWNFGDGSRYRRQGTKGDGRGGIPSVVYRIQLWLEKKGISYCVRGLREVDCGQLQEQAGVHHRGPTENPPNWGVSCLTCIDRL